ncbi:MAG: PKD domain-containing protein, partial [Bacteroidota bacterium]|nr:PKD domain-containing protein [Bacteroidota bacterium]
MYRFTLLLSLVFLVLFSHAQVLDLPDNTPACNIDEITLDAGSGFDSYFWNTGETSQAIVVSVAGTYSVIVAVDGIEQSDETIVEFFDYEMKTVMEQINEICYGSCDGQVMAHVTNGVKPYEYLWNGYTVPWDSIATNLCPGDNNLKVIDDNGCILLNDFVVDALPAAVVEVTIDPTDTLYLQNPTLDFSFENMGSEAISEWEWRFGDGDTSHLENPTHVYEKIMDGMPNNYTVYFEA